MRQSTKSDSKQPVERTVVELRYGFNILEPHLVPKTREYDVENIIIDDKKMYKLCKIMKVIALPFKNEEWCLPSYLHNMTKIVDEIIAIDDGSIDNSVKILEDAGAKVYSSEKLIKFNSGWSEGSIRAELLKLGRKQVEHTLCVLMLMKHLLTH